MGLYALFRYIHIFLALGLIHTNTCTFVSATSLEEPSTQPRQDSNLTALETPHIRRGFGAVCRRLKNAVKKRPKIDEPEIDEAKIEEPQLIVPGVNTFLKGIDESFKDLPAVFYTNEPRKNTYNLGGQVVKSSYYVRDWADEFFDRPRNPDGRLKIPESPCDLRYLTFDLFEIWLAMGNTDSYGLKVDLQELAGDKQMAEWYEDIFQKNQAQALATYVSGDAYLVVPPI